MRVKKLLKNYLGNADLQFYRDKKLIEHTQIIEIFRGYPLDESNYVLLNSKIKSYRVANVADSVLFQINIK